MKLIKMHYKNYSFSINPSSIKIENSKNIANQKIIDYFDNSQMISTKPVIISGSGVIGGSGMYEQMNIIQNLFSKTGSDYLFIPGFKPVKAYFSGLTFKLNSDTNVINYEFRFVEDNVGKTEYYNFGYTVAKSGENLFDVANRLGVNVELLVKHNNFEDLFSLNEGDRVYYA